MVDTLRAWLNSNRDYYTGVALYSKVGDNTALLELFRKGSTPYTVKRLQEELSTICNNLKSKQDVVPIPTENPGIIHSDRHPENKSELPTKLPSKEVQPNHPVYAAAKQQADKSYKEVMNLRAVLFAQASADDYTDPNTPDKIAAREKMAVNVVLGFQKASQLYEKADYIKQHGRLPDEDAETGNDYEALPDHLVKPTLDNLRKNVSKMKKREATPERLAMIHKHESNIEKLKKIWLLLKPALQPLQKT